MTPHVKRTVIRFFIAAMLLLFSSPGPAAGAGANYAYDAAGRLIRAVYTFDRTISYGYDATGNLTALDVLGPTLNQPGLAGVTNPTRTASARPTFTWSASAGASFYRLEIATDSAFAQVVYTANVTGATNHAPTQALPASGRYYWRVRAENDSGLISAWAGSSFVFSPAGAAGWMLLLRQ